MPLLAESWIYLAIMFLTGLGVAWFIWGRGEAED